MAVPIWRNSAEGQEHGTILTVMNSGSDSGDPFTAVRSGAFEFSSDAAMHGDRGYRCTPTSGEHSEARIDWEAAETTHFVGYWRRHAEAEAAHGILMLRNDSGLAVRLVVALSSGGRIILQDAAGSGVYNNSASNVVPNTWYRIEVRATPGDTSSSGELNFALYQGDSTTPVSSFQSGGLNLGGAPITNLRLGRVTPAADLTTSDWDSIGVWTDLGGLPESMANPWPFPEPEMPKPAYVWDGSEWVGTAFQTWDGGGWVPL